MSNDGPPRPDGRLLPPEDKVEIEPFLDRDPEAGVVYVNRRAGAPDRRVARRPTVRRLEGKAPRRIKAGGGFYYVQQFMREQSQTVVD